MTWDSSGIGMPYDRPLDIASFDNGVLLAGTRLNGVFRSVDDGHSWTASNIGLGVRRVNQIEITGTTEALAATGGGVFRTTDAGLTWNQHGTGISTPNVTSIVRSGGTLFAATAGPLPQRGSGVYRSTDNGETWVESNEGIVDTEIWSLLAREDGTLFAGGDDFIYRSTDDGRKWTLLIQNNYIQQVSTLTVNGSGTIYAGIVNNVIRSTDNGNTWSARIRMPGSNYPLVDELLLARDGSLYATTWGAGAFKLRVDNGDIWRKVEQGLPADAVTAMTGRTTAVKYVATTSGIYRLHDTADARWYRTDTETPIAATVMTDYNEGAYVVAATADGLYRFANSSRRWTPMGIGLPDGGVRSFAVNEPTGVIFAGTMHGIFRTDTNMTEWVWASNGLDAEVDAMTITGSSSVLAAVRGQRLRRSTDMGATWLPVTEGLPNRDIVSFAVFGAKTVLAGTDGAGIYRSDDDGATWRALGGTTSTARVTGIAFNSIGSIFASTGDGLYRSTDNGISWTPVNTAASGAVTSMIITGSGDLLAAREGDGLWQSAIVGGTSSVRTVDLDQTAANPTVSPNPASARTTLSFELDQPCAPQLLLVDAAGTIVRRIDAGARQAGEHSISIDAAGLAAGTYFLRLDGCGRPGTTTVTVVR
jgi:photosystem II stability/assembly factor-like uncharacterized protein